MKPSLLPLCVIYFTLLAFPIVARAESTSVNVPATSNPFSSPTIVPLRAGESISIEASGSVRNGSCPPPNCQTTGPSGFGTVRWNSFSAPVGSLIGAFRPGGGWFVVGGHLPTISVPRGANALWLGVMDDNWSDNSGHFSVTVKRETRNIELVVQRNMSCLGGETGGTLYISGRQVARTLELPWRNDERGLSRIQRGTYVGAIRTDGEKGWRIELYNVPNHSNIELHVGNYPSNSIGCILVGTTMKRAADPSGPSAAARGARSAGFSGETCMVYDSRTALNDIRHAMQQASNDGISSQELNITLEVRD
jgi:hypothetical protein